MVWKCTKCANSTETRSVGGLVAIGWQITELGGGICPSCVGKVTDRSFLESTRARAALKVARSSV